MRQYNPNKKIKVEICAAIDPAYGYTIWDISHDISRAISRNASEDDIYNILTEEDFKAFTNGKFTFKVYAGALSSNFDYLYS